MAQIDKNRIADTILAAPVWARDGIANSIPHVRTDAAHELARFIAAAIEAGDVRALVTEPPGLLL